MSFLLKIDIRKCIHLLIYHLFLLLTNLSNCTFTFSEVYNWRQKMHLCNVCNVRPRAYPVSRHVYKNIEILQANSVDLLSFVVHFSKNETCIINYAQFIKQNQRKKYLYDNKLTKRDSCPSDHNTNNPCRPPVNARKQSPIKSFI